MRKWLREWWNGKDVPRPGTGGMIGPLSELPDYDKVPPHWTARSIKGLFGWHARNWDKFWKVVCAFLAVLIAYLALK
jgi:hypothetical protein